MHVASSKTAHANYLNPFPLHLFLLIAVLVLFKPDAYDLYAPQELDALKNAISQPRLRSKSVLNRSEGQSAATSGEKTAKRQYRLVPHFGI